MTLKLGIQHLVLEYYQCFHMVTLGCPWPFLWQGQICFWMLLHGWKLIQHWVQMYFQVCSNSAYPKHSGERYRTNSPLVHSNCSVSVSKTKTHVKSFKIYSVLSPKYRTITEWDINKQIYKHTNNEGIYRNIKWWKYRHVFSSKNLQQYFPHVSHTISQPPPHPTPTHTLLYPLWQLHIPLSSHPPQPKPNPPNSQGSAVAQW